MQVVLLERVDKLGAIGDVVDVKPGFARNFLLPQEKALRATKDNLVRFERERDLVQTRTTTGHEFGLMAPGSLLRVSSGPVRVSRATLQPATCPCRQAAPRPRLARGALPSCRRILDYLGAALTPDELRRDNLVLRAV